MNNAIKINLLATCIIGVLLGNLLHAQNLTVYNDGRSTTYLSSGKAMVIQGSYVSQRKSGVDGVINIQGDVYISGDFSNFNTAATAVSASSAGTVHLNGTTAMQNITGSYDPGFYKLTINNSYTTSPQVQLSISSSVLNTLTMTEGIINLNSRTLTLGSSIASIGTLSHNTTSSNGWMYGGYFKRWLATTTTIANGSAASLFPLGYSTTDFAPLYVSAPATGPTTGGTMTASHNFITGNTDVSFADGASTVERRKNFYWTVSTANGLAGGTYNMRAEGTHFGTVGDVADLRITQTGAAVGTAGVNAGSTSNPQVNRTGLTLANLSNNFYIASVNKTNSPLPVELLSFDAAPNGNTVDVSWSTASEINSNYFIVQRSKDAYSFEDIVQIPAAGNSSVIKNYSAVDFEPYEGISYYRLKQVDFNGDAQLSHIVAVEFHKANVTMDIYPNPSNGDFYITVNGEKGDKIFIMVRDMLGRQLYLKSIVMESPQLVQPLNLTSILTPGTYIITKASDTHTVSKKIVIR